MIVQFKVTLFICVEQLSQLTPVWYYSIPHLTECLCEEKKKILCAFKATVLFFLSIQYSTLLYQLNNITFLLRTILILLLYFNFTLAKFDFVHQLKKRRGIKSTVDVIEYNAKWDSNISLVEGRNIWHHLT